MHFQGLRTFLSFVQWPTWFGVRDCRHQKIIQHDIWQGNRPAHVNLQEILVYFCLHRGWFQSIFQYYFSYWFCSECNIFDLESSTGYCLFFFRVIHKIFVVLIHEIGWQGIWTPTYTTNVIWLWNFPLDTLRFKIYCNINSYLRCWVFKFLKTLQIKCSNQEATSNLFRLS